jgi:hypothetical protein
VHPNCGQHRNRLNYDGIYDGVEHHT